MGNFLKNALKICLDELYSEHDFRRLPLFTPKIGYNYLREYIFSEKNSILEGLVKTFPIETAKKHFIDFLKIDESQFNIVVENGVKVAYITIVDDAKNVNIVEKGMEFYGYYLAKSTKRIIYDLNCVELLFEPKFQDVCNDEVKQYKYLYHITPTVNMVKIKEMGLCPKSKNDTSYFPDRVYLLSGNATNSEINFLASELKKYNNKKHIMGKYTIITIDTSKIPDYVNFRRDAYTEKGFWTYDVIPYSCVDKTENIDLNEPKEAKITKIKK